MSVQGSSPELVSNSSKSVSSGELTPGIKVADDHPDTLGYLEYLAEYLSENSGKSIKSYKALLASLARLSIEKSCNQEFANIEIVEMAQNHYSAWSACDLTEASQLSNNLNKAYAAFSKNHEEIEDGFNKYLLAKKGIRCQLSIVVDKKSGGRGAGDRTKWRLMLTEKNSANTNIKEVRVDGKGKNENQPVSEISYYPAPPNDGRISQSLFRFSSYPLTGWRRALLLTIVITAIVIGIALLWLSFIYYFSLSGDFNTAFMVVVVVAVIGVQVSPFYRVFFWKIVKAPGFFEILDPYSNHQGTLLLVLKKHKRKEGAREIHAKKYSGECPRCKGDVVVVSGGLEFPLRLVGRCLNSPAEHVFSFDISSEQGSSLR